MVYRMILDKTLIVYYILLTNRNNYGLPPIANPPSQGAREQARHCEAIAEAIQLIDLVIK